MNTSKLCPQDWHVPSDAEWTELTNYLGGEDVAGIKMKSTGNSTDGTGLWRKDSTNTEGTNESGFSCLPGGYRTYDGTFSGIGFYGYWWSSTEYDTNHAWDRYLYFDNTGVDKDKDYKERGFPCRCVKD